MHIKLERLLCLIMEGSTAGGGVKRTFSERDGQDDDGDDDRDDDDVTGQAGQLGQPRRARRRPPNTALASFRGLAHVLPFLSLPDVANLVLTNKAMKDFVFEHNGGVCVGPQFSKRVSLWLSLNKVLPTISPDQRGPGLRYYVKDGRDVYSYIETAGGLFSFMFGHHDVFDSPPVKTLASEFGKLLVASIGLWWENSGWPGNSAVLASVARQAYQNPRRFKDLTQRAHDIQPLSMFELEQLIVLGKLVTVIESRLSWVDPNGVVQTPPIPKVTLFR
jgi:hypothetical protein